MDYWTIVMSIIVGIFAIYYFFQRENYFDKNGIPHKKPIFALGNMAGVLFRRYPFVDQLINFYHFEEDAKYVGFYDFRYPVIMIRDMELIRNITVKNFDHFVDHRDLANPDIDPLFANNLFSLHGDKWRSVRNLLTPAFTSSKMKGMFKLMSNCAETFCNSLREQCLEGSTEHDSRNILSRYTNDVIATCAFGIAVDSMKDPNNEFFIFGKRGTNFAGTKALKFFATRSFPTLTKILGIKLIDADVENFFYEIVRDTIATRDAKGINRPDMIQLMMEARNHKNDSKTPELSIENMTSQAFVFFLAGFDTTSLLMCFVAHNLSIHPEVQRKLQNEVDQVMKSCNDQPAYEAINDMEYLDAVINETLRLYPAAVFIDRICTKNFELPPTLPGGKPVMLKPGDNIWIPVWAMHRDPKYFPNPEVFDPERFIGDAKDNLNLNAFSPFGVGPRMCIGNRFALLETKVLFLYLLAKFNIEPGRKMMLPLQLSRATFAIVAEGGFWIDLKPRQLSH